jgi:hypothetical protein
MTSESGSFARRTIVKRKPQIIQQVIEDTPYPPDIVRALGAFAEEIATSSMQPLQERTTHGEAEVALWNHELAKYQGRPWLDAPWYFAEAYFYRRLMETVRYFQPGPWKYHDPFGVKKRAQIAQTIAGALGSTDLAEILEEAGARSETFAQQDGETFAQRDRETFAQRDRETFAQQDRETFAQQDRETFAQRGRRDGARSETFAQHTEESVFDVLLHAALWGNRADLSNYTVARGEPGRETLAALMAQVGDERPNVLIDHTDAVRQLLSTPVSEGTQHIAFINDNVGLDVLFDLMLSDFMLDRGWVHAVTLHLKAWPFFVSDAMPEDIFTTITLLQSSGNASVRQLGTRLFTYIETGHLILKADPFWTSPLMFRQMPASLREALAQTDLVILKGDVNYRRLLGDRHWPYTTQMEAVTTYFPAPFLVLRTLKGEIMVGLQPGQAEAMAAEDPTWLINGKRGVIQLVYPQENRS